MKRARALSLALLMIVCSLAGCIGSDSDDKEEKKTDDQNPIDDGNETTDNNNVEISAEQSDCDTTAINPNLYPWLNNNFYDS